MVSEVTKKYIGRDYYTFFVSGYIIFSYINKHFSSFTASAISTSTSNTVVYFCMFSLILRYLYVKMRRAMDGIK